MRRSLVSWTALLFAAMAVSGLFTDAGAQQVLARLSIVRQPTSTSPVFALASAVIPGSGQLLAGKKRGLMYLAAETVLLTWHLRSAAIGRRERNEYRDLAFNVARAPFMPTTRDTAFGYFEDMADFIASGPFDVDPGQDLVPPTDESTFNGSIWALARSNFFEDLINPPPPGSEAYSRALAFYRARAVGPNFRWSWEGDPAAQETFGRGITASDDAFRRGTMLLGFVLANHLVSAVDAHISHQLSGNPRIVKARTRLELDYRWPGRSRVTWGLAVSF